MEPLVLIAAFFGTVCEIEFNNLIRHYPASILSQKSCSDFPETYHKHLVLLNELSEQDGHVDEENRSGMIAGFNVENDVVDKTQGLGAFEDMLMLGFLKPETSNLDLGGGKFNIASAYLKAFNINNYVYDPYGRSLAHNEMVLRHRTYDSVTSFSVLNVILNQELRKSHIEQSFDHLKVGGLAMFKVYEGNGLGIPSRWQNHLRTSEYVKEIAAVYGEGHVSLYDNNNLIVAKK